MTREEAINTVRNIYQTDKEKEALEVLIPELAESEDERIRRTLVEYFGPQAQLDFIRGVPIKKIRDWLEKQKEQKPLHWRRIEDATTQRTDDGCCVTSEKMLVKGWMSDEDYRIVDEGTMVNRDILCIPVRELNAEQKEQRPISFYGHYNPDDYEVVIEGNATSLKKKELKPWKVGANAYFTPEQKPAEYIKRNSKEWYSLLAEQYDKGFWKGKAEQKPAEWSEEDQKGLNRAINICISDFGEESETARFLKSLPGRFNLQPKAEWSEEDETCLEYALWCVMKTRHFAVKDDCDLDACQRAEQWLKSLRPQYHGDVTMTEAYKMGKEAGEASSWKPSEEHLSALLAVFNDPNNIGSQTCQLALTDLYEQLKKL